MNMLWAATASAALSLCLGAAAASAGVSPGIGEAAKSAVGQSQAGVVEQANWGRHRRHRGYAFYGPRTYGYRSYRYGRRW